MNVHIQIRHVKPFTCEAMGRRVALRCFQAPAETPDDAQAMAPRVAAAFACALRNRKPTPRR